MSAEKEQYPWGRRIVNGAADGTRTRNNQLGRLMLYQLNYRRKYGRADRIRTCDPLLPKQMRYQAALQPDYAQQWGPDSGTRP